MKKIFVTAINCMDGRAQEPVINYLKKGCGADYVDMITEPGPEKVLSDSKNTHTLGSIKEKINISVTKHGSKIIAIAGHYDCAGNPAEESEQKQQLCNAKELIKEWNFPVEKIVALWLDEKFSVSEIK